MKSAKLTKADARSENMKINIVAVGKLKESYLKDAANEYIKRISRFFNLSIIEVEEAASESNITKKAELEGVQLLSKARGYLITLDRLGAMITSEEMAERIGGLGTGGVSEITFIIGGSNGLAQSVLKRADCSISFGALTYPHQLFRIMLLEQIYRSGSIMNGTAYHK